MRAVYEDCQRARRLHVVVVVVKNSCTFVPVRSWSMHESRQKFAEPPHSRDSPAPSKHHDRCFLFLCSTTRSRRRRPFRPRHPGVSPPNPTSPTPGDAQSPAALAYHIHRSAKRYIPIAKPKSLDHRRRQYGALQRHRLEWPAGQWL